MTAEYGVGDGRAKAKGSKNNHAVQGEAGRLRKLHRPTPGRVNLRGAVPGQPPACLIPWQLFRSDLELANAVLNRSGKIVGLHFGEGETSSRPGCRR